MMSAPIHKFNILNESLGAFHERRASLTLPASDCTSCLNLQLQPRSRYGWKHQCLGVNVIWPPSNFQMHHLAGNHLNAPPDCRSTRTHNYRQTPRLPGYSWYLGKSRVRLHRTRISLLSWMLLQSQPFIKLQEWVLLTLGGLKVTGLNISKRISSRQADWQVRAWPQDNSGQDFSHVLSLNVVY